MTGLFLVLSVIAFLYCASQYGIAFYAVIDLLPPELKNDFTAKFALHRTALSRTTPLSIQGAYVKSLAAGALFGLCLSLSVFSIGQVLGGWALFVIVLIMAGSAIKAWWTYEKNRDWQSARDDKERA